MNWQGEQVCSVLAQRLLSSPWVQRLQVTGTGIGWFVGLTIVSIPATTVLIRDPHPIRQRRVGTIPSSVVGSIRVGPSVCTAALSCLSRLALHRTDYVTADTHLVIPAIR